MKSLDCLKSFGFNNGVKIAQIDVAILQRGLSLTEVVF